MKIFKNLSLVILLASVIVLTNCGPKDPDGKDKVDALKEQAGKLVQSWTLVANGAKLESDVVATWNGFTLDFTGDKEGGDFSTNVSSLSGDGVSTEVWPASGGWAFLNDGNKDIIGTVVRDNDNVEMDVSVTATSLEITFTIGNSARLDAVDGNWSFVFERAN